MKKLIVLTLTVIMVLSLVAPSIALAGTTSVNI
jgi:surface glycoprotein (TIGR04207 family)